MIGYRIKVVLLTLGVVLGFGSALARHQGWIHGGYGRHQHGPCWGDWGVESGKSHDAARPADR